MSTLYGFREGSSNDLIIEDYVLRVLSDIARQLCYDQIQIPVLEPASSYSEKVTGNSPWPEWNRKGCFFFEIENYTDSYDEEPETEKVLLIPEGTISVTRWLGDMMQKSVNFPLKMFYNLRCYRNELISTLSLTKGREFIQFGLEILGTDNPHSDVEILCMISHSLVKLGMKPKEIRIRLNDITIFNRLICESSLQECSTELKELLDTLAEVKAGKGTERTDDTLRRIARILDSHRVTGDVRKKWQYIIDQKNYDIAEAEKFFGRDYLKPLSDLRQICMAFERNGVRVVADLCVIRSHEYYTSLSYEVDVLTRDNSYIEIAGGGRYDRLVSSFVPESCPIKKVPCTGFAFGIERVINMLKTENRLTGNVSVKSLFCFDSTPPKVIIPESKAPGDYINEFVKAIDNNEPVSIWLGN